jgi:hypothetical protein
MTETRRIKNRYRLTECLICGHRWEQNPKAAPHTLCQTCRRKEKKIDYGHAQPCKPWQGDFDDSDNPLKNGRLYLPGERVCGHRDCVEKKHIKPTAEQLIAEQFSVYYRTGEKRNYKQLIAQITAEKREIENSKV